MHFCRNIDSYEALVVINYRNIFLFIGFVSDVLCSLEIANETLGVLLPPVRNPCARTLLYSDPRLSCWYYLFKAFLPESVQLTGAITVECFSQVHDKIIIVRFKLTTIVTVNGTPTQSATLPHFIWYGNF